MFAWGMGRLGGDSLCDVVILVSEDGETIMQPFLAKNTL